MSGAIPPLPNTPSRRGAQLKHRENNKNNKNKKLKHRCTNREFFQDLNNIQKDYVKKNPYFSTGLSKILRFPYLRSLNKRASRV
jgi:hypothetical protein